MFYFFWLLQALKEAFGAINGFTYFICSLTCLLISWENQELHSVWAPDYRNRVRSSNSFLHTCRLDKCLNRWVNRNTSAFRRHSVAEADSVLGGDGQILTPLHQLVIVCGSPWGGHDLGPGNSLQQTQFLGLTPGGCLQLNTARSWVASSLMRGM